jgi:glucosamine--fructose-6-phosphate aminotransferase (isomerizing)
MCGIVGYIGEEDAATIILEGLKKLEYRGYDSAGIAVIENGKIQIRRSAGKLEKLITSINEDPLNAKIGIGHTRWATHGVPSARNAHPHVGATGKVVVVHNGIVENYLELREKLRNEGVVFNSDTDSETIVHLIEKYMSIGNNLVTSLRLCLQELKGAHGVVVLSSEEPDRIIAARIGNAGGVVVGYGKGEMFVASDTPAILEHTRNITFLESHQIAIIYKDHLRFENIEGVEVKSQLIQFLGTQFQQQKEIIGILCRRKFMNKYVD